MRLDKFLSHAGLGSRKEVKVLIKKQVVTVDGVRERDGKKEVNAEKSQVSLDGERVYYQRFYYYLLHKPQGVISATEDRQQRTVIDLLDKADYRGDLFPVGRLDKDTTGLLLLTNDGAFSHRLLSPKKKVPKRYRAQVAGMVTVVDGERFAEGIEISGAEKCLPAVLTILSVDTESKQSEVCLTIVEGKYHQVKRMFEAVGKQVLRLHRETMGPLELDETLAPGKYRPLTLDELALLKA